MNVKNIVQNICFFVFVSNKDIFLLHYSFNTFTTMKKSIIIEDYIMGLCSFLDENGINWEFSADRKIKVYYTDENQLFKLAFEFGLFYSQNY